jgi:hypothetical protein
VITDPRQHARREPPYDIDPRTGASIEVFYADRTLETFGKCGAGWFWQSRRRGYPPECQSTGPFATSYAAYRHAMITPAPSFSGGIPIPRRARQLHNLALAASTLLPRKSMVEATARTD